MIDVKKLRIMKGYTLRQLHLLTGISISHLHDIENGYKAPTIWIALDIAKALDVDVNELFYYG